MLPLSQIQHRNSGGRLVSHWVIINDGLNSLSTYHKQQTHSYFFFFSFISFSMFVTFVCLSSLYVW